MWNFSLNKKKKLTKCCKLLKEAYGENSLSHVYVFEWCKQFSEDQESTEDDQHPGSSVCDSTLQTVTKISEIVRGDRCMSIRVIAETVNTDKELLEKF